MKVSFLEWAAAQNPNQGDYVYFGVHDLIRQLRQTGQLPELTPDVVGPKLGRIVGEDYVKGTFTVETSNDPYSFGYHKLESPSVRQKRKAGGAGQPVQVQIPIESIYREPITELLGPESHGVVLWLAVDNQTGFQKQLAVELRKHKYQNMMGVEKQQPQPQKALPSPNAIQPAKSVAPGAVPSPYLAPLQAASFDPSIMSNGRYWKQFNDNRYYEYLPE